MLHTMTIGDRHYPFDLSVAVMRKSQVFLRGLQHALITREPTDDEMRLLLNAFVPDIETETMESLNRAELAKLLSFVFRDWLAMGLREVAAMEN